MENVKESINELKTIIEKYSNIVFFGGAGVSTESGIPDFRSVDGLYHQQYDYPPETILSHTFYQRKPKEFFRFYRNKMLFLDAKPNGAHKKLAELEGQGKLKAVITQNIDGLHQAAGSKTVLELHGSVLRNYCEKCGQFYDVQYIQNSSDVPKCEKCGGRVKPDVVLYEEGLDARTMADAMRYIHDAQVLIIGGTSLAVYPAAGLIDYFKQRTSLYPIPSSSKHFLTISRSVFKVFTRSVTGFSFSYPVKIFSVSSLPYCPASFSFKYSGTLGCIIPLPFPDFLNLIKNDYLNTHNLIFLIFSGYKPLFFPAPARNLSRPPSLRIQPVRLKACSQNYIWDLRYCKRECSDQSHM